jgi:hypothetical protein
MIKVGETDYFIDADEHQFILYEWAGGMTAPDKDGVRRQRFAATYYYTDLASLITGLAHHLTRGSIAAHVTLEGLFSEIKQIKRLISEIHAMLTPNIPAKVRTEPLDAFDMDMVGN